MQCTEHESLSSPRVRTVATCVVADIGSLSTALTTIILTAPSCCNHTPPSCYLPGTAPQCGCPSLLPSSSAAVRQGMAQKSSASNSSLTWPQWRNSRRTASPNQVQQRGSGKPGAAREAHAALLTHSCCPPCTLMMPSLYTHAALLVGAGSDAASLRTTAVRDGDDLILNGSKVEWSVRVRVITRVAQVQGRLPMVHCALLEHTIVLY